MTLPSGGGLPGYLQELDSKYALVEEDLKAKLNDPELGRFSREWLPKIPSFHRSIRRMLADQDLLHPSIYDQSAQQFSQLYSVFRILESFLLPVTANFSPRSRALTKLVGALGKEVGWPMGPAYVNAGTQMGPATVAPLSGMFLPLYEYRELTGLPAAAHELGHILCGDMSNFAKLVGDWDKQLGQHLQNEELAPDPLSKSYPHLRQLYSNWMSEFICDMVATYVTGESFGFAWTQLATQMGGDVYEPAVSHPADEARIRGAAFVLEAMGDYSGAQEVRDLWNRTVPENLSVMASDYLRIFPDDLVRGLAKNVVDGCKDIGLMRYDAPQHRQGDIVDLIKQSCEKMVNDPSGYGAWKRDTMTKLYKKLGVSGVGLDGVGGVNDLAA